MSAESRTTRQQVARLAAELAVFDVLDDAVVAVDPAGLIVFANRAAERLFGYGSAEMLGQPLELLIPEDSRGRHGRHVEAFRQSCHRSRMMGERSDIHGRRSDGSTFPAEASISRSCIDGCETLLAIVRDVTARQAREARAVASEQKHRAILDTCTDAILLADAGTGLIVEANQQAAELFGCRIRDLLGRHQSELHPEQDRERLRRAFQKHIEQGLVLVPDATILRDDGRIVPVEIAARPTHIAGVLTVVGYFRDITHRLERERQLIEAREAAMAATQSKTTFLANVSHELRTPLNAIIGMSATIAGEYFGPIGVRRYVEYAHDIRDSGNHLLDLINDILDVSRLEMNKVALQDDDIDLVELLERTRRTLGPLVEEHRLTCRTRVAPGGRRLRADSRAVRQMLINLMSNAVKHTPAGGSIEVTAGPTPDGELVLDVVDTGHGIEPERLAQVTMPFNSSNLRLTSATGGTGLGLAITKGLAERHGGRLEISSRLGVGTSVRLIFPADRVVRATERGPAGSYSAGCGTGASVPAATGDRRRENRV